MGITGRIIKTLTMPLLMFVAFIIISNVNGTSYGNTSISWLIMLENTIASCTIAFALAVQIRSGRFDFSGGAIMTVVAIAGGHMCKTNGYSAWTMLVACVVLSVLASMIIAAVYIYGKLPIVICTIGMALLLEAFTNLINEGKGVSLIAEKSLTVFGVMPDQLIIFALSVGIFLLYTQYSLSGKRAQILTNNQKAAVDIGINEKRNVFESFVISGTLYGLAAVILVSRASPSLAGVPTTLGTIGTAFSAIMPVFIGLFIGKYSNHVVGIFLAALTIQFMTYGIEVNSPAVLRSAYSNMATGLFMITFFIVTKQGPKIIEMMKVKFTEAKV